MRAPGSARLEGAEKDGDLFERYVVEALVLLFVFAESNGYCFDVLVRRAIEEGERVPRPVDSLEKLR